MFYCERYTDYMNLTYSDIQSVNGVIPQGGQPQATAQEGIDIAIILLLLNYPLNCYTGIYIMLQHTVVHLYVVCYGH